MTLPERYICERLFSVDFPGRREIQHQLERSHVRQLDVNGSLGFIAPTTPIANVLGRIPVEGHFKDSDSVLIHILLHVIEGLVSELEVFKEDSSRVRKMPPAEQLEVEIYQP